MKRLVDKLLEQAEAEHVAPALTEEQATFIAKGLLTYFDITEEYALNCLRYTNNSVDDNSNMG